MVNIALMAAFVMRALRSERAEATDGYTMEIKGGRGNGQP